MVFFCSLSRLAIFILRIRTADLLFSAPEQLVHGSGMVRFEFQFDTFTGMIHFCVNMKGLSKVFPLQGMTSDYSG